MIERPVFQASFHVEVIEPEGVFLLSEQGHFLLKGELYCRIARLLDGSHTADGIVDALADEASAAEVYYALSLLEARGYTVAAALEVPSERAAFWQAAGVDAATAERRLREASVAVVAAGAVAIEPVAEALGAMGLRVAEQGEFTVVVTDDYLQDGLAEINAAALGSGKPWLLVKPVGTVLWMGPVFRPGEGPCWECLAQRLRGNREVEGYLLGRKERQAPFRVARAGMPAGVGAAAQLAALEVAKVVGRGLPHPFMPRSGATDDDNGAAQWQEGQARDLGQARALGQAQGPAPTDTSPDLVGAAPRGRPLVPKRPPRSPYSRDPDPLAGSAQSDAELLTLDTLTLETRRHTVVRRPQCPRCGVLDDPYQREGLLVTLKPQPKAFTADGGHRTVSPEQTLARFERQVSPISGAISLLARTPISGSDALHVYVAGHNFAMKADSLYFLRRGLRSNSAGKGVSDAQAKASALCEGIERYSGIFQGNETRRSASLRQLGPAAIHPNACMLFSEAQYAKRAELNARGGRFSFITYPFDEDAVVDWTPVWSLTGQAFKYLPTGYCYYGYPAPPDQRYYWAADSNGNASGNTLEEAILQGFFELVERDSVALWWYNRIPRPALDLDSFGEPYVDQLRAEYRKLRRELWVLDLTSDLDIPVFAALSRNVDKPVEEILMGFGAHFDPRIALLRALTEMNQMLGMAAAADTPAGEDDDPDTRHWMTTATLANQPYVAYNGASPRRRASFADLSTNDIAEDVRRCQRIVEQRGMELLVLDQTRPDIGLAVAKVFVPGLRHFWARFAPGRLYDVPVQLGWLPAPLSEDQLNPMPMFL